MTTVEAMQEVFELLARQHGGELEEFHILRGKHEEILESSSSGDDRGDYSSGVRCELEEELIAV